MPSAFALVSRVADGVGSPTGRLRLADLRGHLVFIIPATVRAGDARTVDFSRDVLPILSENCLLCHGPDAKTRKADLRLDVKESALRTKDPVIVPGKSGESELIRRIEQRRPGGGDAAAEVGPQAHRRSRSRR